MAKKQDLDKMYKVCYDRPLGEGSFGLVWKAQHRNDKSQTFAVKKIKMAGVSKAETREF